MLFSVFLKSLTLAFSLYVSALFLAKGVCAAPTQPAVCLQV
jgi:hypothetical protein